MISARPLSEYPQGPRQKRKSDMRSFYDAFGCNTNANSAQRYDFSANQRAYTKKIFFFRAFAFDPILRAPPGTHRSGAAGTGAVKSAETPAHRHKPAQKSRIRCRRTRHRMRKSKPRPAVRNNGRSDLSSGPSPAGPAARAAASSPRPSPRHAPSRPRPSADARPHRWRSPQTDRHPTGP